MKNITLLLCTAALGTMAVGCNNPAPTTDAGTDAGGGGGDMGMRDTGMGVDMGAMPDMGTDAFAGPDTNVTLDCAGYCTQVTTNCTAANAQYTDMADCMTQCTAAAWTPGAASDTGGNTLGCRIYHALASAADAATHCSHAGWLGGGVCTPFRTDAPTEVAVDYTDPAHPLHPAGYVRVDRMGVPAVATALIGPGLGTMAAQEKNNYNDSNPTGDAAFASGVQLLTAVGALHSVLDDDLVGAGFTPCNVTHTFDIGAAAPVPVCGVQHIDGSPLAGPGAPVVALIRPDTLRVDPTAPSGFPNGRELDDAVIDPILSALLLNLEPCAGTPTCQTHTTMGTCTPDATCAWVPTSATSGVCLPLSCASLTTQTMCGANPLCTWQGPSATTGVCAPIPCEAIPMASLCGAQAGCSAATCAGSRCNIGSFSALPLNPPTNDLAFDTAFPYFADPH